MILVWGKFFILVANDARKRKDAEMFFTGDLKVLQTLKLDIVLSIFTSTPGQCDQIRQFIALVATFQSLWQQLFCPSCPHLR